MQFVPWRYVADWKCVQCGDCCRLYSVMLNFREWLTIVKGFGVEQTFSGLNRLFIKRRDDGSCAFLCKYFDTFACGLQHMKPTACQLWPFKILAQPKYGGGNDAVYRHGGYDVFIYLDSMCSGIRYGTPKWEFFKFTLGEFTEIAMGLRKVQYRSTGDARYSEPTISARRIRASSF